MAVEEGEGPRLAPGMPAGEAVERRGDEAIVLRESPRAARRRQVEESAIEMRLLVELGLHGGEEVRGVQAAVEPAIEHGGAGGEIEWRRDGYRGRHRHRHAIAELAQPLEDDVPAQRDADQAQAESRLTIEEAADQEVEVSRVARVIEATGTIHLAAAGTEMHHEAAPAHLLQATEQA